jgi:zinc/manganese transport system substrate-binding protein
MLLLGACSGGSGAAASGGTEGAIHVVAAENFYGDIARQIGGPAVRVTSVLNDPNADPHLFEPGTTTGAAVSDAGVVVENGAGYDAWMDRLVAATPNPARQVVNVGQVLGVTDAGANPHLWYDVPRLPDIASAIAKALEKVDPANAARYRAREAEFVASLAPLDEAVDAIKTRFAGAPVAYTEPVPGYLLEAAGLDVKTPDAFARAIEQGSDPTPQAVAEMQALLTGGQVKVLLYNAQATSPMTDQIRQLAAQHSIPVVPVTETLPSGVAFQDWQLSQVRALASALGR